MRHVRATTTSWLAGELRRAILAGELLPGQPLRQAHLARQYGVSTIPVREALSQLEAEGFAESRPYRGMVVRSLCLSDLKELVELRRLLEPLALRLAAPNLTERDLERAETALQRSLGAKGPADWLEHFLEYHQVLVGACGQPLLTQLLLQLYALTGRYVYQWHGQPEHRAAGNQPLREVIERLRQADVDGAMAVQADILRHITAAVGAMSNPAAPAPAT